MTNGRFQKLSGKYEAEQPIIEKNIEVLKADIERLSANKQDTSAWIEHIKKYTDIQELDRIVLGEPVEKITVSEAQVIDGTKHIGITIHYRFVGALKIA